MLPTSSDWDRLLACESLDGSGWKAARCCESIERFSSTGVKMLCCFCFLDIGSFDRSVLSSGGRSSRDGSRLISICTGGGGSWITG